MVQFCAHLGDAEAQSEFSVKFCMGKVKLAGGVEPAEQFFIQPVVAFNPEADQVQRRRSNDFEAIVFSH